MSELRPSFEERDRYLDLLAAAYADGRIDDAEFQRRSDGVLAAVTHRDAIAQFDGLPRPNVLPAPVYMPPIESVPVTRPPALFELAPDASPGDRRAFLVLGGLGVAAVLGFGMFSTPRVTGTDSWGVEDVSGTMGFESPDEWPGWVQMMAEMAEDSHGHFTALTVEATGAVADVVGDPQTGSLPERMVLVPGSDIAWESLEGGQSAYRAPVLEVAESFKVAMGEASAHGETPTSAELVWDRSGEPQIRVVVDDRGLTRALTFDKFGALVSQEELG